MPRLFYIHLELFRDIQARVIYRTDNEESEKITPILVFGNNLGVTSFLSRETLPYGHGWKMRYNVFHEIFKKLGYLVHKIKMLKKISVFFKRI